jgi:hypothetical protein
MSGWMRTDLVALKKIKILHDEAVRLHNEMEDKNSREALIQKSKAIAFGQCLHALGYDEIDENCDYTLDEILDDLDEEEETVYKLEKWGKDYYYIIRVFVDEDKLHFVSIPNEDDKDWSFWVRGDKVPLMDNFYADTWWISDKEKESLKKQIIKYCLENGYTYDGECFKLKEN